MALQMAIRRLAIKLNILASSLHRKLGLSELENISPRLGASDLFYLVLVG